ncbi:S4 domain-containing protein [Candidatus Vidania fulgoroideorum]
MKRGKLCKKTNFNLELFVNLKKIKFLGYNKLSKMKILKTIYGVRKKNIKNYCKIYKINIKNYDSISKILEKRIDNIIFRMGFCFTRKHARQLINHRHVYLNNKIITFPSKILKVGDMIEIKNHSFKNFKKEIKENFFLDFKSFRGIIIKKINYNIFKNEY